MASLEKIAFAMGGLAGNNGHGAGFLQAALEKNVRPMMISCTSGQIFWVYQYLRVLEEQTSEDLTSIFYHELDAMRPTRNINMDWQLLTCLGKPGVFRPAGLEFLADLGENMTQAAMKLVQNPASSHVQELVWATIPGRVLVPLFPDELFQNIADTFNASSIGILFNTYNPREGVEHVHLNHAACQALGVTYDQSNAYRVRTLYKPITKDYVKFGLWIYQYGFDENPEMFDGAYYRQIILSELVPADRIYVVRPLNSKWIGPLPTSYIGVEDLKTETSFNGTYAGERDKIYLINKLLKEKKLQTDKYHPIELVEIEVKTQEGFFDYVFEDEKVFERARNQGLKCLERS